MTITETAGANARWHQAVPYGSPEEFTAWAVPYLAEARRNGAKVLVVTSDENAALIRPHVGNGDLGREVEFVDSASWYSTPARTMAAYHDYVERQRGYRPLKILGEPLWDQEPAARYTWHRYESLINLAFANSDVTIACPYDTSALDASVVEMARRTHPFVVEREHVVTSFSFLEPIDFLRVHEVGSFPSPCLSAEVTTLEFEATNLILLRQMVARQAVDQGVQDAQVSDLTVAANEVATNVLQHGGGRGWLRMWVENGDLVIEIQDQGVHPLDPLAGHLPPAQGDAAENGRGLWIARQLCDRVEVRASPGWVVRLYCGLR